MAPKGILIVISVMALSLGQFASNVSAASPSSVASSTTSRSDAQNLDSNLRQPDISSFMASLNSMSSAAQYRSRDSPAPLLDNVNGSRVDDHYLIKVMQNATDQIADNTGSLLQMLGGSQVTYLDTLRVYHMDFSATEDGYMPYIQSIPWVEAIEPNYVFTIGAQQVAVTSSIDRMDQRNLPLDGIYNYEWTGNSVNVYILDTGVFAEHQEFSGRVVPFYSAYDNILNTTDCNGHGSHVAGSAAGVSVGIAKRAMIYAMRVFTCQGSTDAATLMTAVQFLMANFMAPAVANLSLGGPVSTLLDQAVQAAIALGISFVIAAGNSDQDACTFSPGRVPEAITVAAVDGTDTRASFSNFGTCVDVFAPGVNVYSVSIASTISYRLDTGTSMSTPLVAGIAAMILEKYPTATPAQVQEMLKAAATSGVVTDDMTSTPLMAYSNFLGYNPNNVAVTIQSTNVSTVSLPTTIAVVIVGAVAAGAFVGVGLFVFRRIRNHNLQKNKPAAASPSSSTSAGNNIRSATAATSAAPANSHGAATSGSVPAYAASSTSSSSASSSATSNSSSSASYSPSNTYQAPTKSSPSPSPFNPNYSSPSSRNDYQTSIDVNQLQQHGNPAPSAPPSYTPIAPPSYTPASAAASSPGFPAARYSPYGNNSTGNGYKPQPPAPNYNGSNQGGAPNRPQEPSYSAPRYSPEFGSQSNISYRSDYI